jgi:hypothetical protein
MKLTYVVDSSSEAEKRGAMKASRLEQTTLAAKLSSRPVLVRAAARLNLPLQRSSRLETINKSANANAGTAKTFRWADQPYGKGATFH